MNLADLSTVDLVGSLLGFIFTLFVFSYILGDNVLFRIAIYVFVGVAAGFVAAMAWQSVIMPQLLIPLLFGSQSERMLAIVPLILSGMLLAKAIPRFSVLGSPVMAYLVGVGAAAAIGGAVMGTLFPQIRASTNLLSIQVINQSGQSWLVQSINGVVILIGTVATLAYFHYGAHRRKDQASLGFSVLQIVAWIGQAFIAITFGVLYAGILGASLSALIERLIFLVNFVLSFILPAS